jgi:NAD(P)-dependent dehydrogenase (short-subunit alcohol dehydrogenase family)
MTASTASFLSGQTVAVFGGGSGIGLAVARRARDAGARAVAVGRDRERLAAALREAGGGIEAALADVTDEAAVAAVLSDLGALDHVVVTAGGVVGPAAIAGLDFAAAHAALQAKLVGSLHVAKHAAPRLRAGGSIGFTTGLLARKPTPGTVVKTVINGGLEAAVRQLARELAPLRVYGVSPGPVDTPNWGPMTEAERAARRARFAAGLPVGFLPTADDAAEAYLFAMRARALTGTVIDLDGGALVGG